MKTHMMAAATGTQNGNRISISLVNYHRLRFQIFYMALAMPAATPAGLPVWRPQFSLFLKCPHNSSSFQRGTY